MERQSMVQTVEVAQDRTVHSAPYFIEAGVINAEIGGRIILCPLGGVPAADTVRTLLAGHLLQQARKMDYARLWTARRSDRLENRRTQAAKVR
jgi:hypothetical protein